MIEIANQQTPLDVEAIRGDFPILQQKIHSNRPLIYFDNGASTQRPSSVVNAITEIYQRSYANVHRGIHWLSEQSTIQYEASRVAVAQLIGAASDRQVIFTSGTTLSINLVARCLGDSQDPECSVRPGDEILLTEMEHHSNIVPWQQLAQRTGAIVKFVSITDDGMLCLDSLEEQLTERTKVFAFAAVSNMLGTINPVKELVARARAVGALTCIDAAQHVPHEPTNVQDWDADFVNFSAHKMLGPSGLGILYGRQELLERLPPFLGGGSMISKVTKEGYVDGVLPAKFEAGTPPIAAAISFQPAIEYLQHLGFESIKEHEQILAARAIEQLNARIPGIRIFGPGSDRMDLRAGIVSFVVDGCSPQDLSLLVDRKGVAIRAGHHCAMPLHERLGVASSCRASFYLYNSVEEVDAFVDILEQVVNKLR